MNIPLLDPTRDKKEMKEIKEAVTKVIDSGKYIGGEEVKKFEEEFAKYVGAKFCVSLNSGTDALVAAYRSFDVKNKEIIIPADTFIATSNAAIYCGGVPSFIDVDEKSYNLNSKLLKNKINEKTRMVVPVHLFGQPCEMDEILSVARSNNLAVIEDCAQAVGATYKGKKVGLFGYVGCFSFYPSKNLGAIGDGGAVVTNDEAIATGIRNFGNYGQSKKYYHDSFGINSRLDAVQAAALRVKLKNLDKKIKERRKIAALYSKLIQESKFSGKVIVPTEKENCYHTYYLYAIRVLGEKRDPLLQHLNKNGIGAQIHYPIPIHKQKSYRQYGNESYPVAERVAKEFLSLPMFPELTEEEIMFVVDSMKKFFS